MNASICFILFHVFFTLVKLLQFFYIFAKKVNISHFREMLQKFYICTKIRFKAKQKIMDFLMMREFGVKEMGYSMSGGGMRMKGGTWEGGMR